MGLNQTDTELIAGLDHLTKQGQRLEVLKKLARILKNGSLTELRPYLARIANRNHAYDIALRILHPVIRDEREKKIDAGPEALNVYATSLMWIGALEESHECLQRIRGSTDALLTQAFLYFAQWEYSKAIPVLLKYTQSNDINSYQKLVGHINLLAAYVAIGDVKQALAVFEPLIKELKANPNYKLLAGNCLELRSQIEILNHSYAKALEFLKESENFLSDQPGRYLLYVNKWKAIAGLGLTPANTSAQNALQAVKNEALSLKNWETIRDCDFHLARINNDQQLMQRILLGTPYTAYHERVKSLFDISLSESKDLEFCPGSIDLKPNRVGLNLNQICDSAFLHSTSWPLLQLLTKDIYRPARMGVVFSGLYPGEFYDPFHSPQRVRNSVFRFNQWAEQNKCPFRIRIKGRDFQLLAPKGTSIICSKRKRPLENWQAVLKVFKEKNQSRSFTSLEFADVVGLSQRGCLHILQKALASNKIQKIGHGKNSRYIFFSGRRAA